ncbi:hypothetical protein BC827DRAFT_1159983 [Russula dissimulans]|nr:hypothetical protein BC827DRAFT_1159983 [Russula dissimulans]
MVVVDNCCHIRSEIVRVFPGIDVALDVWHFMRRYMAVVLGGIHNPRHGMIAKEVVNAVLVSRADGNSPAVYHTQSEQERRLQAMFEKWCSEDGIWSAAVLKWAYSSGIVIMQALVHDFVLRCNIRIGHATCHDDNLSPCSPFLQSTYGSHHTHLVTHMAALWNVLIGKKRVKVTSQIPRPELQIVHSGETFGIAASDHATTFGGLIEIKEEPHDGNGLWDFLAQDDSDDSDINPILQDLNIDPMLLQVPHQHNANANANTSVPQHVDNTHIGTWPATIDLTQGDSAEA